jgi:hypothetical protein
MDPPSDQEIRKSESGERSSMTRTHGTSSALQFSYSQVYTISPHQHWQPVSKESTPTTARSSRGRSKEGPGAAARWQALGNTTTSVHDASVVGRAVLCGCAVRRSGTRSVLSTETGVLCSRCAPADVSAQLEAGETSSKGAHPRRFSRLRRRRRGGSRAALPRTSLRQTGEGEESQERGAADEHVEIDKLVLW